MLSFCLRSTKPEVQNDNMVYIILPRIMVAKMSIKMVILKTLISRN